MYLGAVGPRDSRVVMLLPGRCIFGTRGEKWVPSVSSTKLSCAQSVLTFGLQFSMAMEFSCCAHWEVAAIF